ncbi:MAG: hypothetical protein ACR2L3_01000 [Actinomycetota bacterium]
MSLGTLILGLVAVIVLGPIFGWVRAAVAVAMFGVIALYGARQVRSIMLAPPEPELADVREYDLRYVCNMCGLELKVEVAAKDRPPTHCMEPMELVRAGEPPPLRSVE